MFKKIILLSALLLASCISIEAETREPAQAAFITSTLPPTKAVTPRPTGTPVPEVTVTPTVAITIPANCTDSAVLLEDVTILDGTRVSPGQKFTKTWRFLNNGTCPWVDYTIRFAAGDQMSAPLSAPIPLTEAKSKVDISVELTAPSADGSYTSYFTLNNVDGKDVPIGVEKTFWVKIVVGAGTVPSTPGSSPTQSSSSGGGGANCSYSQNAGYASQIASLINGERANAGLPALTVNAALTTAAQGHAADMACNNMISHTGSDGSNVHSRVAAAGYSPSYSDEIIYAGGGPQAAMTWWMSDKIHRDAILNPKAAEMGVGYAYYSNGSYGDYITVDFGSP
ncbi:MAG: hypothetical protein HZB19_06655 [Chloroflexi bacterium]|nr:hypothetical protein [Chloroflexota bacterium]